MDRRAKKGEETYSKIIDTAIKMISENGIGCVSAAKVSQGAGISKSSVFHHFKSVNDIMVAALERIMDLMASVVHNEEFTSVEALLNAFDHMLFSENDNYKVVERAFFAFYTEGMFNPVYKDRLRIFLDESVEHLRNKLVQLGVDHQLAEELARLILASLDGLCIHVVLTDSRESYHTVWASLKEMITKKVMEDQ